MNRLHILALAVIALLVPAYWIFWTSPAVGHFHDDGVYIVTAQAIAAGHGYTTDSLPHPIAQTKYPPLYAAVLALVTLVTPAFPHNVLALKAVSLATMLLWLAIVWRYLSPQLGRVGSLWIVVLTLASPWVLFLGTNVLSDIPFAALVAAALLTLRPVEFAVAEGRPIPWTRLLLGSAIAALAFLTRSAGITLIAAAVILLLTKRRWTAAAAVLAVCSLAVVPWFVWQWAHPIPVDPVAAYYTNANYSTGMMSSKNGLSDVLRVGGFNSLFLLLGFASLSGLGISPIGLLLGATLSVLAILGLFRHLKREPFCLLGTWVILSCLLFLPWTWPPLRYEAPLLPWLYAYAVMAVPLKASKKWALGASLSVILLLDAFTLAGTVRQTTAAGMSTFPATQPDDWGRTMRLYEWVQKNTPQDAILSTNCDPQVYLFTGRKAIRTFAVDQVLLSYHPGDDDRKPLGTPEDLRRHILANRISYLVLTPMKMYAEGPFFHDQLARLRAERPGAFTTAFDAGGSYYVLAVDGSKL